MSKKHQPCPISERLYRIKRQSERGSLTFGQNEGANVAPLSGILPSSNIGRSSGGQVNAAQPSGSFGRSTDIFGLFSRQQGVQGGLRPGNNVGASWGDQTGVLNQGLSWGNQHNVNVNGTNGKLDVQNQKGIPGIWTETDNTNVNPMALQFGNQRQKCFGGAFFGGDGICTHDNKGVGGR